MPNSSIATATKWAAITAHDTNVLTSYRALYCVTAGNLVIDDHLDNEETFPVVVGQIIPVQPKRLKTTSTATAIGLN